MEGLAVLVVLLTLVSVPIILYRRAKTRQEKERLKAQAEATEQNRIKECGEVVLFYANHLGYRHFRSNGTESWHKHSGIIFTSR